MNCHFVIRSLTEPWELNKDRRLKYFDFTTGKVGEGDSKNLLAEEDLNSFEIEALLNTLVDQPIDKFKGDLVSGQDALKVGYWRTFRALHLYFLIQAPRYSKSNNPKEAEDLLDQTLRKGEAYLDQLVQVRMETYDLRLFKLPEGRILCFPSTGFFSFPIEDAGCETGFTFSYGVPIFPDVALTLTPKTATEDGLKLLKEQLHGFSVGLTDTCDKVVLPKEMVEQLSEADIVQMMTQLREATRQATAATNELRSLVVKMYETAGLKLGPIKRGQ
jgi:hypothetical protein